MVAAAPPTLTLPRKGGGDGQHLASFPSPVAGESRGGGSAVSRDVAWFASCGTTLRLDEIATTEAYLAALGLPRVPIGGVATWREAAALAQRDDWSRDWWQAEEIERAALGRAAAAAKGETALLNSLSRAMEATASPIQAAASAALGRAGIADEMLARVAAGAASQACHHYALAQEAGRGADHAFAHKYRLYRGGRWLLGVVGECCFVF